MELDNKNSCGHTEDFRLEESKFEVISVTDPKYMKPHHLLVETTITSFRAIRSGVEYFHQSKIDILVRYLYGPQVESIGHIVSHMGGETLQRGTVKLASYDVMVKIINLRGLHIGTYVFNKIVTWAKKLGEELLVHPVWLSPVDARDEKSRDSRNGFYRKFGLKFNFREANGIANADGTSLSTLTVRDLIADEHWPNIQRLHRLDGFRELAEAFHVARRKQRENFHLYTLNRRRADRFEKKVAIVTRYLHMTINLPLYAIVAFLAFSVGRNWSDWMISARHFLKFL